MSIYIYIHVNSAISNIGYSGCPLYRIVYRIFFHFPLVCFALLYAGINFIHNHPPGTRLQESKNPPPLGTIIVYKNAPLGTEQGVKSPTPGT